MQTLPIRPIPPGAYEALGGEPMLPPALPTQPVAPHSDPAAPADIPESPGLPTQLVRGGGFQPPRPAPPIISDPAPSAAPLKRRKPTPPAVTDSPPAVTDSPPAVPADPPLPQ